MAVEYDISSDVAVIKETGSVSQCARVTQMYSGQITYDDEAGSKFATATINGKSQRVMLCIAVSGTVTYDDVPSLYSTVDGHRCLNIVTPTETGTPDDVPSLYETVVIDGQNVRAVRCIMINKTPVYDGVSSTCTFTGDDGKTHTAQLVNKVTGGSVVVIIKGTSPLNLPDAIANSLSYVKAFGGTEQNGTPTPDTPVDIVSNNGVLRIQGSATGTVTQAGTPTPTEPIYPVFYQKGNLVLRAVDGHADTYDATTQTITRNVGVKVFNGTENFSVIRNTFRYSLIGLLMDTKIICSHFDGDVSPSVPTSNQPDLTVKNNASDNNKAYFKYAAKTTVEDFQQWLADQYNAGTPVTIIYPLITPTTESFTPSAYADGTVETINAHGKNLFDGESEPGYISDSGLYTASANAMRTISFIPVSPNKQYTFSADGNPNTYLRIHCYGINKEWISMLLKLNNGKTGSVTIPSNAYYLKASYSNLFTNIQIELGSTATAYAPYYDGGTATAEMLLKVGDYQDVQSIISGVVTRNVGILVLDGTENWTRLSPNNAYYISIPEMKPCNPVEKGLSTHFVGTNAATASMPDYSVKNTYATGAGGQVGAISIKVNSISTAADFQQFLADQYAAGTPVILVYPLATPTTESVAGQHLQVQTGDNTLEITQASLTGLELEAEYSAAVSLTIQEVEDANLDNNVEVTIS